MTKRDIIHKTFRVTPATRQKLDHLKGKFGSTHTVIVLSLTSKIPAKYRAVGVRKTATITVNFTPHTWKMLVNMSKLLKLTEVSALSSCIDNLYHRT